MKHPRVRRASIAVYSTALRANAFLSPPRVLLNGPGKSGTHLLADCVGLLPRMMFSGRHFGLTEVEKKTPAVSFSLATQKKNLANYLDRCPNGMFVTAHAPHDEWLAETLRRLGYRHILLLRDPRDVAVSRAFFRQRLSWHPQHRYFNETLTSDEERILATICGVDDPDAGVMLLSIGAGYRRMMQWRDRDDTLVVRFEDLVGPAGGGQLEPQLAAIERIATFVDRPIDSERAAFIAENMYSRKSMTYRKGKVGDWRNHFTETHNVAFKEVAAEILVDLGYEQSNDW